ncbi:MAG: DoxX family protein [Micavibrio sp.]|nr:MAG: DoxX family protein [Micavibrio sp.]
MLKCNAVLKIAQIKLSIAENLLAPLMLLVTRLYIGNVFWKSGKTKLDGGPEQTEQLFEWEYIPNWEANSTKSFFGIEINFPVPSVEFAATSATYLEIILPVLLFIGLFGRGAAFLLFGMALTIEIFVYPGVTEHIYWMLLLGLLVVFGPGKFSIDYFIRRKTLADIPPFFKVFPAQAPSCPTGQKSDKAVRKEETKEKDQ